MFRHSPRCMDWARFLRRRRISDRKPVALVGAGAKLSGAIPELRRLLDDLNVPTFATVHGLGAVPPQAPYFRSEAGGAGRRGGKTFGSDSGVAAAARRFECSDIRHGAWIGRGSSAGAVLPGYGWHARHARSQHRFARN